MNRRAWVASLAALLSQLGEAEAADSASHVKTIMHRAAPDVALDGASITVAEVAYPPGGSSERHRHGGFVVAYVLEGAVQSQVSGESERTFTKGQVFYEPPGSIHAVSRNASKTEPARLLAVLITFKGQPVTQPA